MSDTRCVMQLVGRSAEITRLTGALEAALRGQGRLCLLTGEPGIGKSRLCGELAERAPEGSVVAWGACWESGGAPAYWPWVQVLRGVMRQCDDAQVKKLLGTRAIWLAQLLPELRSRAESSHEAPRLEPNEARFQLFDAVTGFLCDAGASRPLVIFLEDLHAADTSSVSLLDFISRSVRGNPLLIVGTFRDAEAHAGPLAPLLAELTRHSESISLQRLDEACVEALLDTELGRKTPPETVREAYRVSEGNPLFAREVLRLLQANVELRASMPEGARGAIRARLERIPRHTLDVLQAASVIGREFSRLRLASLLDRGDAELDEALRVAHGAHLLDTASGPSLRFSHGLIREVLYADLERARCEALHAALAKLLSDAGEESISELAHHLVRAGSELRGQARAALKRVAQSAEARFAFDDAAEAYALARELCESEEEEAFGLELAQSRAQLLSGATAASRATCEATLRRAQRLGSPEWVARAALARGGALVFGAVDADLVRSLSDALGALDERHDALRAEVMARLAAAMQPARDPAVPVEMAQRAIALVRTTDDLHARLRVLDHGCSSMMDLVPADVRQPYNREFTELAEALGAPVQALRGYQRLLFDAAEQGLVAEVQRNLVRASEVAELLAHPHYRWPIAALSAMVSIFRGDLSEAEVQRRDFLRLSSRTHDLNSQVAYALQELELMRVGGFTSLDAWQRSAAQVHATSPLMREFRKVLELEGVARAGQLEDARALLARIDIDLLLGDSSGLLPVVFAVHAVGEPKLATRLLAVLGPRRSSLVSWGAVGMVWGPPISLLTALLHQVLGDDASATRDLQLARECLERCGGLAWLRVVDAALSGEPSAPKPNQGVVVGRPTLDGGFLLERQGEGWLVGCAGRSYQLKATKGIELLATLTAHPGREFHCLDLCGTPREVQAALDSGETHLDDTARQQYRQRYGELRAELDEAEAMNDPGRQERLRAELEALSGELARGVGLGGRLRGTSKAAERARVNVQRRLKNAIERVWKLDEELGKHLEWAVRTGTFCSYDPQ